MQLSEHYIHLRSQYAEVTEGTRLPITQKELSDVLLCTERNVKIILKQMAEHNWIAWMPGRGRGNHSHLTFLVPVDEVVIGQAKDLVKKGNISDALSLLSRQGVRQSAKAQFVDWLYQHFGHSVEQVESKQLDTLRISFYRAIPALDPAFVVRRTESHMVSQIFDTLVKYDAETDRVLPQLAHYWESDETKTNWTFYLRKGVLFHHGRELTADDVKRTIERICDPQIGSPFRWMFEQIEAILVPKDTVVHFKLRTPNQLFLHFLASNRASIVPSEVCKEMGADFAKRPIGTGPFRLVKNDDTLLQLDANTGYFQGRAHLDRIEIWVIPELEKLSNADPNVKDNQVYYRPFSRAGEADIAWKGIDRVEVGSKYLTFNLNKNGPGRHLSFRQLFNRLLNKQRMVDELGENRLFPAKSLLPEQSQEMQLLMPTEREITRFLAESGYQGECLQLFTYEGSSNEADAEWLRTEFARFGIKIEVTAYPIDQLKKGTCARAADMILTGEVFDEDLVFGLIEMYRSEGNFLRQHVSPELLHMIDQQTEETLRRDSKRERMHILLQLEEALKDQHAILFLYHLRQSTTYHPALKGVTLNSLGWVNYKDIWY